MADGVNYGYSSERDIDAYNKGWADFMVTILREQIDKLKITDTGSLYQSIRELTTTGSVTTIEHRFLLYGIYVAAGVGNGFRHGNGGDLLFMGDEYRAGKRQYGRRQVGAGLSSRAMLAPKYEHVTVQRGENKGKPAALTSGRKREAKDFFFKKYYYSLQRLNEENARFFGELYSGMASDFLQRLFSGLSAREAERSGNLELAAEIRNKGIRSNRF